MPKKVFGSEYFEVPWKEDPFIESQEISSIDQDGNTQAVGKNYWKKDLQKDQNE